MGGGVGVAGVHVTVWALRLLVAKRVVTVPSGATVEVPRSIESGSRVTLGSRGDVVSGSGLLLAQLYNGQSTTGVTKLGTATPCRTTSAAASRRSRAAMDNTITEWAPAHANLTRANLTGPQCRLLGWEDSGLAPRGLDATTLLLASLAVPTLARRVRQTQERLAPCYSQLHDEGPDTPSWFVALSTWGADVVSDASFFEASGAAQLFIARAMNIHTKRLS